MAEATAARPTPKDIIPGVDSKKILGTNPQEIPIPLGIRWAINTYDTQGNMDESRFGITTIGMGRNVIQLLERDGRTPVAVQSELQGANTNPDYSRIHLGYLGSQHSIRVAAEPTKPFSLDDPDRLNTSAIVASDFGTEHAALNARDKVEVAEKAFEQAITNIGRGVDSSILELIAIMDESLKREKAAAPGKVEKIAQRMRALHLLSINTASGNSMPGETPQYTPEVIDKLAEEIRQKNLSQAESPRGLHYPRR